ncbi:DOMON-like domain-containing protein [Sphingomonas sp. M1-B02]|uniref:DOMON-like domain-containing protein n=1 Tax=Sphingomonas sp. M1-B02 TaxID=3114300 RepID=UPI00223EF574|nr:DOMON-like domain-containing protein [Sphingomonas sp. S6-11]UZK67127.1 DOMON-like domain-containing protein [Sphingomonas sp. S6-11]
MKLIPHPDFPPKGVAAVDVAGAVERGRTLLTYRVSGGAVAFPPRAAPVRTDDLWKRTCFELFVQPEGKAGYCEFNFSPSGEWGAYRFEGYRTGMADLPLAAPTIEMLDDGVRVTVDLSGLSPGALRVGITAVIEEQDGTRSFWALAHPAEKPDFHDPAGFVLRI